MAARRKGDEVMSMWYPEKVILHPNIFDELISDPYKV